MATEEYHLGQRAILSVHASHKGGFLNSMGRILEYVVLLSTLSLILGAQQFKQHGNNYEREKQENLTHAVKQYFPKEQNEFFNKKVLPLDLQNQRQPKPKQMLTTLGLHAFEWKPRIRNSTEQHIGHSNSQRRNVPSFSQALHPRKNFKNSWSVDFHGQIPSQRLTKIYNPNSSLNYQSKRPEDVNRRFHKDLRNARYHQRQAKICDPCNSVPWVPLLKVPESYRKQRTHVTELHPAPHQNFNFDYHAFASSTHNVLLPPVSLEPVYDGTISSSFGLPIGNIPTSHGLLAPINPLATQVNKYPTNTIDYGSSFNYFAPQGLLDSHPFPELSPVPIVPIHDSEPFYQFDSSISDLVPPPTKAMDVSNVVLTIAEEPPDLTPPKPVFHNHKPDLSSESSAVDSLKSHSQNQSKDFGRLEIIKSVPLAEFSSSVDYSPQDLPLYPPLQSEFSKGFVDSKGFHSPETASDNSNSNFDLLVPPVKPETNFSFAQLPEKSELHRDATVPKPLTSPSLSWLFSDHTASPSESKNTASVSSFATEAQEIASVVNNELRPISPHPLPSSPPNVGNTKSKKIQIIIPYTTKNKNGHDNNALESIQHEVFQPPVSKPTSENNSLRDFATSALPSYESNRKRKVNDGIENKLRIENQQTGENKNHKYLSEMHHIIASNIRELLREEIQKSQSDQNYRLQNNIDNWTALEYSNHKTLETKAPKEIITQALAVTSIPGTSISHLLLPSKKIPNEYFITTPLPVYDEPSTPSYKTLNSTVNSRPFTAKPYATTNVYNPTRGTTENKNQNKENTPGLSQINHEKNYTEVGRGKVNNWRRLNENLVLPEARSKTRKTEQSTTSGWNRSAYTSSGSEKVQIVTPISVTTQRNYSVTAFRRTTRQIQRTDGVTTVTPVQKPLFPNRLNSTKLEKVSNQASPFNRKFTYSSVVTQLVNSTGSVLNVERTNDSVTDKKGGVETNVKVLSKNQTNEEVESFSKTGHLSINDVFPFRNKELPWESNLNSSEAILQVGRQRKSLIKQVYLQKSNPVGGSS